MTNRSRNHICLWLLLVWLLSSCTVTLTGQLEVDPRPARAERSAATTVVSTPVAESLPSNSAVTATGATISGQVFWGASPVPEARVELRSGAWADPSRSQIVANTIADDQGHYELHVPPVEGDFGLVAVWPDGAGSTAAVTPVQVAAGSQLTGVDLFLARTLVMLEPAFGTAVGPTPTIRWAGQPEVVRYQLWVIDAGTSELVFDLAITENLAAEMSITLPPLTPGRTYTWEVQGLDPAGRLLTRLVSQFEVSLPSPNQ